MLSLLLINRSLQSEQMGFQQDCYLLQRKNRKTQCGNPRREGHCQTTFTIQPKTQEPLSVANKQGIEIHLQTIKESSTVKSLPVKVIVTHKIKDNPVCITGFLILTEICLLLNTPKYKEMRI